MVLSQLALDELMVGAGGGIWTLSHPTIIKPKILLLFENGGVRNNGSIMQVYKFAMLVTAIIQPQKSMHDYCIFEVPCCFGPHPHAPEIIQPCLINSNSFAVHVFWYQDVFHVCTDMNSDNSRDLVYEVGFYVISSLITR